VASTAVAVRLNAQGSDPFAVGLHSQTVEDFAGELAPTEVPADSPHSDSPNAIATAAPPYRRPDHIAH
jgi:hypothetical protein